MLMNTLGWNALLVGMSVVTILSTLPILIIRKPINQNISSTKINSSKTFSGLRDFLVQPKVIKVLTLIAAFRMLEGFIRSLLPTMFKDWGMKFEEIGLILGVIAPVSALLGALLAGLFINRLGRFQALMIFGAMQIVSVLGYMVLSVSTHSLNFFSVLPVVIIDHTISGMTTVALFSLMMDWSRKRHGGTDYTAMDCIGVFAMMLGASTSYLIASKGGYSLSFGLGVPLILLSLFIVRSLYRQLQNDKYWRDITAGNSLTSEAF
jgi:PAT family beta-lactamase induction signal transducer AmpG